jgi:hypothetical protein
VAQLNIRVLGTQLSHNILPQLADLHSKHGNRIERRRKKKKGLHGAHTQLRCNGPQPRKGTKDPLQGLKRREQTAQKGEKPTPEESAEGTV